jgi:hypothetical protein
LALSFSKIFAVHGSRCCETWPQMIEEDVVGAIALTVRLR